MYFRIKINESIFKVPVLQKKGWENLFLTGGWFTDLLKYLKADKSWIVIDVGANIGQTLLKLKSINNEIRYYGFEPNPACVNYLTSLIAKNRFINTSLFPVGIYNKTDLLTFYHYTDSETDPSASIIPDYRAEEAIINTQIVPVFEINSITPIRELKQINLIKIDVEGAELEVLFSCEEIIKKHSPLIIIEILPVYTTDNLVRKDRLGKIEEFVKRINYNIFLIRKGRNECFDNLEKKESVGIHGNILNIDYLLTPVKSD